MRLVQSREAGTDAPLVMRQGKAVASCRWRCATGGRGSGGNPVSIGSGICLKRQFLLDLRCFRTAACSLLEDGPLRREKFRRGRCVRR
jgi:hypothetical protein